MYSTASFSPACACSGGRYAMRMCLPIDGPAPALVTYERRPFASVIGAPSGVHDRLAAERVALHAARRRVVVDRQRAEHRRRLRSRGARRAPPCRRSPRPSPSTTPCPPRPRRSPRRARCRTRGSTSPAGRSCRRRRCRPGRRRAAGPPPTARPRAARRPPSGRRSPSRGRRRTRSATRYAWNPSSSSSFHVPNGKPSLRDVGARDRREDVARARPPQPDRALLRGVVVDPRAVGADGRRTTSCPPCRARRR